MTRDEWLRLVAVLSAAYPQHEVRPETVELYYEMLKGIEYCDAQQGVRRHVASSKFFPTVSELLTGIAAQRCAIPNAEEAWAEVQDVRAEWGEYIGITKISGGQARSFEGWSSPVIETAVKAIGWMEVCRGDPSFVRRDFLRVYAGLAQRAEDVLRIGGVLPAPRPNVTGQYHISAHLARMMVNGAKALPDGEPVPIGPHVLDDEPADVPF